MCALAWERREAKFDEGDSTASWPIGRRISRIAVEDLNWRQGERFGKTKTGYAMSGPVVIIQLFCLWTASDEYDFE
jgi:hypothetical protein